MTFTDVLAALNGIRLQEGTEADVLLSGADRPWALAAMIVLGGLACWGAWRTLGTIQRFRRVLLTTLRVLGVGLLVLILLQPSLVLLSPMMEREKVGVLLDISRSMSVRPRVDGPTRWERVLEAFEDGPLARLVRDYDVEFYTFGEHLERLPSAEAPEVPAPWAEDTDLGEAFDALRRDGRDMTLGALVVVSDGIDRGRVRRRWRTEGDDGLARELAALKMPVHTYFPGGKGQFVDVAIDDLRYNAFAFLRQPFEVEVRVRAVGLEGVTTAFRLSSAGRTIHSQRVRLGSDGETTTVRFTIDPDRVGRFTYTVSTPVLEHEAVAENNTRSFTLKVVRDKIRVLQVAGAPSWDVRFLRRLLKSDPNIDLVSFFILRGLLDPWLFDSSEYSLIEFPYQDLFDRKKDLDGFDVLIFQNFNYGPYFRSNAAYLLESIASWVEEGGGLAVLGGEMAFGAGDLRGTPLERVLPVKMDRRPAVVSLPTRFRVTAKGLRHPITTLHFDPKENAAIWNRLPPLDGYNPTSPWPDAVVLGHVAGDPAMPLMVAREVGRGRSFALTSDGSWRWSFKAVGEGQGNLAYLRLWKNALRWLVGDPDEALLQVETDKENYVLGEDTVIQVHVVGPDYSPRRDIPVHLRLLRDDGRGEERRLDGVSGDDGQFVWHVQADSVGPYRVVAAAETFEGRKEKAVTVFTVGESGPEMKELAGDRAFLAALASLSGGSALGPDFKGPLRLRARSESLLVSRRVVPLWDKYPPYLGLLGLFGIEWLLRRRWGLI